MRAWCGFQAAAAVLALSSVALAAGEANQSYVERFTAACESGSLVEVLLGLSFTAEKTRSAFCGCLLETIGELAAPEQDFVVRLLSTLESNAADQQVYADTGQAIEIAFDGCVASQGLSPPRD